MRKNEDLQSQCSLAILALSDLETESYEDAEEVAFRMGKVSGMSELLFQINETASGEIQHIVSTYCSEQLDYCNNFTA